MSLESQDVRTRPSQIDVYEADRQRVVVSLTPETNRVDSVTYWIYHDAEGEDFETRTDLNLDGEVDVIVSSRTGARILLDSRWVPARGSGRSREVDLAGEPAHAEFKGGKWPMEGQSPSRGGREGNAAAWFERHNHLLFARGSEQVLGEGNEQGGGRLSAGQVCLRSRCRGEPHCHPEGIGAGSVLLRA